MIRILQKTVAATIFTFIAASAFCQKPASEIDYQTFIHETQRLKNDAGSMQMAWWLPGEIWGIMAAKSPEMTEEMVYDITSSLQGYTVMCVVDAKINGTNMVNLPDKQVRKNLSIEFNNLTYEPVEENDLSSEALMVKGIIEPIFEKMLGNLGSGMTIYFFETVDPTGRNYLTATSSNSFKIKVNQTNFDWALPLPSVLEDKVCPKDNEAFQGNYVYCPFHGVELKGQSNANRDLPPPPEAEPPLSSPPPAKKKDPLMKHE